MKMGRIEARVLTGLTLAALVASGIDPYDRMTWAMETLPVMIGLPALLLTHRRFPLTPLVVRLLFAHGLILMLGGHYTYARVPLGFWVQDALDLARNHYDRLGIWRRASFRRCWRAKSCSDGRRSCPAAGCFF